MTGWLQGTAAWGRPVDVAVDPQGNILISDDGSGTIYKLTYNPSLGLPPRGYLPWTAR